MKSNLEAARRAEGGFTLIELLVVVLIIGILASIAVPQYFKVVEKGKAAEAISWLQSLKGAQERYLAKNGNYAAILTGLDVNIGGMRNFGTANPAVGSDAGGPYWTVGLPRNATPAVYGQYTVTFGAGGNAYGGGSIGCAGSASAGACQTDLMP